MQSPVSTIVNRRHLPLLFVLLLLGGAFVYCFRVTTNPAGFFVDESSVAYNAYTISQSGRDEFGHAWPLFFQAFGDFKNPVHIYLMAMLFKLTGPSILTARLLSAVAGVITAVLLGLLAMRISGRQGVGLLTTLSALLTPWLFEISRIAFEVSLYPLALTVFLVCVFRSSRRASWGWSDVVSLALTLALLTYTYSIGRLFGPLLALGLLFFVTRKRVVQLLTTWTIYILTALPMIFFQRWHDDALTGRFKLISYIRPESSISEVARTFIRHLAGNVDPRNYLLSGDPNIYQVAHVQGTAAMLTATMVLAVMGVWLVARQDRNNAWWRFVVYGLLVSLVPASLTMDYFHMLRLVPMPVFLIVLTVPALVWIRDPGRGQRGLLLAVVLAATLIQGLFFQWQYHKAAQSPWRRHLFDADYPEKIFDKAVSAGVGPVFLADSLSTPYIQAYWYATLKGIPVSQFVRLKPNEVPPVGKLVISTEEGCLHQRVVAQVEPYTLYIADQQPYIRGPLPDSGMRAEITVLNSVPRVGAGQKGQLRVHIKNAGNSIWPGCDRMNGPFEIRLGSHWTSTVSQAFTSEIGRSPLPGELRPGDEADVVFSFNAPTAPGEYILELDLLQEGVAWFASKGSQTAKVSIKVE
jgi:4-amino-4-deoxy-L-arabinose transferase-like glycosyltransferase